MGKLVFHPEDFADSGDPFVGRIDLAQWPGKPPADTREKAVATERLLWRRDGSLAYAVGREYPIEELPLLIPHDEWIAEQSGDKPLPKRGRKT